MRYKTKILMVDDDENILSGYKRTLRSRFTVITANSADEGIEKIKSDKPFAVVISDFKMPGKNGIEFLTIAREMIPETTRMLLTGYADLQTAIDSVNKVNIFRLITKPCESEDLIKIIDQGVEQYQLVISEKELLQKTFRGSIKLMVDMLAAVNPIVFSQSARLRELADKIAKRMKLTNLWEVEIGALLSQIGCVTLPNDILNKKYSGKKLSTDENNLFRTHPSIAESILKNIPRLEKVSRIISFQLDDYKESSYQKLDGSELELMTAGLLLRVIVDFDFLVISEKSFTSAFQQLLKRRYFYHPEVIKALEAELVGLESGFILRTVKSRDINMGTKLADDIFDVDGTKLLSKGVEMSPLLKLRITNYVSMHRIDENIRIFERVDK